MLRYTYRGKQHAVDLDGNATVGELQQLIRAKRALPGWGCGGLAPPWPLV